jgi:hypothetical protein
MAIHCRAAKNSLRGTGHLELAGFYFSKCPANSKYPAKFVTRCQVQALIFILILPGFEHARLTLKLSLAALGSI